MPQALGPNEIPPLPQGASHGWARSSRRGSVYHAHNHGRLLCNPTRSLERHKTYEHPQLHDLKYWGVCPRCLAMGQKNPQRESV